MCGNCKSVASQQNHFLNLLQRECSCVKICKAATRQRACDRKNKIFFKATLQNMLQNKRPSTKQVQKRTAKAGCSLPTTLQVHRVFNHASLGASTIKGRRCKLANTRFFKNIVLAHSETQWISGRYQNQLQVRKATRSSQ